MFPVDVDQAGSQRHVGNVEPPQLRSEAPPPLDVRRTCGHASPSIRAERIRTRKTHPLGYSTMDDGRPCQPSDEGVLTATSISPMKDKGEPP